MRELVVGVDGFVGSRLFAMAGGMGTTRRDQIAVAHGSTGFTLRHHPLDLASIHMEGLPEADIVYICAGINGAKDCEGNAHAYKVNVDGTIKLAQHYAKDGFVVWISSTVVMWSNSAYARMKQATESVLLTIPNVGIVRPGRIVKSNRDELCGLLIEVGRNKLAGLHLWGEDEKPYDNNK